MFDREDIIEALEYLISPVCTNTQFDYCDEIRAAINLLKAQEPRVLTPEEMEDFENAVYFEAYFTDAYYVLIYNIDPHAGMNGECTLVNVTPGEHHQRTWEFEDYGKIWRCWSSKPTQEQMEATPWKE